MTPTWRSSGLPTVSLLDTFLHFFSPSGSSPPFSTPARFVCPDSYLNTELHGSNLHF